MKYNISEQNTKMIIDELGEEYKDMLIERVLEETDEIDVDRISLSDLVRLDIATKARLRSNKKARNKRKMYSYIATLGLVYILIGVFLILYSSFDNHTLRDNSLQFISAFFIIFGFLTTGLSMILLKNKSTEIQSENRIITEYEIINKWKEIEVLIVQLIPENNKLSLNAMIKQLSDASIISSEDAEVIKRILKIRNQVVHMRPTDYTFTQPELEMLFSKSDDIIRKMNRIV